MKNSKIETAIIVKSKTRLEQLTARFNTVDQAKFYVKKSQEVYKERKSKKIGFKSSYNDINTNFGLGYNKNSIGFDTPKNIFTKSKKKRTKIGFEQKQQQIEEQKTTNDFSQYELESESFYSTLKLVENKIREVIKVKVIDQSFLPNYIFSEKNLIIVVGQDGLVANTAKYVNNIPIIAINPDENRYDGVLLPFNADNFMTAVHNVLSGNYNSTKVTMAEAKLNDGQRLLAFNDFYIGVSSHSSARYQISIDEKVENHSSSGIIVSTGAGSTGWLSSIFNMTNGLIKAFSSNMPIEKITVPKDAEKLLFVVREPFISKTSKAEIVAGEIVKNNILTIESFMPENGIIFSDGILSDYLTFNSGAIVEIGIAHEKAVLVIQ